MNDPQNLYCRAWQYLFEIVTVAKNDCILTDSDRCSQCCYCNRFLPALCRSIFLRWRKQLSVLFGLVVGYIVAIAMGVVDFSALQGTSIIALPRLMPFKPEFNLNAIISVTLIFLVSATETIDDTSALAASGLNREASLKETSGSIACDGFISALSSVFGCLPITSFSQNVGLVAMTKVVNRFAIASDAIIMILAGIFPFFGALLATLPDAVLVCLCILRWKQGGTWYYQSLILMCIKSPIRFSLYP